MKYSDLRIVSVRIENIVLSNVSHVLDDFVDEISASLILAKNIISLFHWTKIKNIGGHFI